MPNPFPGMNPYLENGKLWGSVHHGLIYTIMRQINQKIAAPLFARIEERVYLIETYPPASRQRLRADVAVVEPASSGRMSGGAAVLDRTTSEQSIHVPVLVRSVLEEVREPYIEIVSADDPANVITVVEVLSPTNKTIGDGFEEYKRKQRNLLLSETHLVEIDLLRSGQHTVSALMSDLQDAFPSWHYLFCIHRAGSGDAVEAWAQRLQNPLPTISIPLTPNLADIPLDLQAVVNQVYDEGLLERGIDYTREPEPPLLPGDAEWADGLLRDRGLR